MTSAVQAPHARADRLDARQRRRQRPTVRTDRIEQRLERLEAPDRRELAPAAGDLEASPLVVSGQERVAHRRLQIALVRVPVGGTPVELRDQLGRLARQDRSQDPGEEPVVAVPGAVVVERRQEQVVAMELPQQGRRAGHPRDGVAQGSRQPLQHRRPQQEVAPSGVERTEHLGRQVVDDVAARAREAADEGAAVLGGPEAEGGEVEPGRPTLRALLEGLARPHPSRSRSSRSLRKRSASVSSKRSCASRISSSSPAARQRPSGSGGSERVSEHDPERIRPAVDQPREQLVAAGVGHPVVVIEDQDDRRRAVPPRSLSSRGITVSARSAPGAAADRCGRRTDGDPGVTQGRHDALHEPHRVAVRGLEGEPRDRRAGRPRPAAHAAWSCRTPSGPTRPSGCAWRPDRAARSRCGRGTSSGADHGGCSFVSSSGHVPASMGRSSRVEGILSMIGTPAMGRLRRGGGGGLYPRARPSTRTCGPQPNHPGVERRRGDVAAR